MNVHPACQYDDDVVPRGLGKNQGLGHREFELAESWFGDIIFENVLFGLPS